MELVVLKVDAQFHDSRAKILQRPAELSGFRSGAKLKDAKDETDEDRAKRTAEYATLTRQYVMTSEMSFSRFRAYFFAMLTFFQVITTSPQTCTSMVGASPSTSADTLSVKLSTKPFLDTNTTSRTKLALRRE